MRKNTLFSFENPKIWQNKNKKQLQWIAFVRATYVWLFFMPKYNFSMMMKKIKITFFSVISKFSHRNTFFTLGLVSSMIVSFVIGGLSSSASAQEVRDIVFPIQGDYQPFGDSYGDPRSGGRSHEGIDILADKMTPLIAVVDGVVSFAPAEEPYWGYALHIRDDEGWEYRYLHINNDTPGTDDNNGGFEYAFAPGIERGVSVSQGQIIAYVGDSGNAESVGSHLHFEIHQPGGWSGDPINPYPSLVAALEGNEERIDYNPEVAEEAAPTISIDKRLEPPVFGEIPCEADSLIKSESSKAVYYCATNRKRYVFPSDKVFFTWYNDFDDVITITDAELAAVALGGNVTYKPGTQLIKITTDPKVYAVDRGGVLRWMTSPEVAKTLYGENWADLVHDVSDAYFINYVIGEPIG